MITSRLILALSTSLGGVCAHVVAERAPMITAAAVIPRQVDNPQGFVGYYSSSGALACESGPGGETMCILIVLKGRLRNV